MTEQLSSKIFLHCSQRNS